jgi:tRNA-binding EMAP/Myf-like protein
VTGKVVIFYNLKPKKLAGMDSAGMVMCASDKEHKQVVFLRPDDSASLGSRVVLKNHPVPPVTEGFISNNHLKKFLEMLRTDENGDSFFGTELLTVENSSLITTSIKNGNIG